MGRESEWVFAKDCESCARLRTVLRVLVDEVNAFKVVYESASDSPLVINDYMEKIFAKAAAAEAEGEV